MSFKKSLEEGKDGESQILSLLESLDIPCCLNDRPKQYKWDIAFWLNHTLYFAEIKNDVYATKSQNICIEFFNPKLGLKSGLEITEGTIWFHIVPGTAIYMTGVESLKQFIVNNTPCRTIKKCGDGNSSVHLYSLARITENQFVSVTKENFLEILDELIS